MTEIEGVFQSLLDEIDPQIAEFKKRKEAMNFLKNRRTRLREEMQKYGEAKSDILELYLDDIGGIENTQQSNYVKHALIAMNSGRTGIGLVSSNEMYWKDGQKIDFNGAYEISLVAEKAHQASRYGCIDALTEAISDESRFTPAFVNSVYDNFPKLRPVQMGDLETKELENRVQTENDLKPEVTQPTYDDSQDKQIPSDDLPIKDSQSGVIKLDELKPDVPACNWRKFEANNELKPTGLNQLADSIIESANTPGTVYPKLALDTIF
tara:strand:- start:613 stop:1410 length:798 start_codon:yes stop_codon:yes gene_type:complete